MKEKDSWIGIVLGRGESTAGLSQTGERRACNTIFQERRVHWPGKSGGGEAFLVFLAFLIEFRRCEMHA